jgi:hypothetical protein
MKRILREKDGQVRRLREQLVPANLDELNKAMQADNNLASFLNTKAKDLPEEYKFLIQEITSENENKTLLSAIQASLTWNIRGTKMVSYFSKAGNKLTGFAAYIVRDKEVLEIKMFSFTPLQSATILIKDLDILLAKLVTEYSKISWTALEKNPANQMYQKANIKYGGKKLRKDEEGIIHYCIERKYQENTTDAVHADDETTNTEPLVTVYPVDEQDNDKRDDKNPNC